MKWSALILAGGKSSRMGHDKAWLDCDGKPLLARQIDVAREAGATEILISGRAEVDYSRFGCKVLRDELAEAGPLAGIERGLAVALNPLVLVLAVDLPRMTPDFLRRLAAYCPEGAGVVPRVSGLLEPLVAVYPREALSIALSQLERRAFAAKDFAAACVSASLARIIDIGADDARCFLNWNSPADIS